MTSEQRRALSELFAELFAINNDDLVICLGGHPHVDRGFLAGLPPSGTTASATFQWRVIERLESHGLIDRDLFVALAEVRKAQAKTATVARLFGVTGLGGGGGELARKILFLCADAEDPETPLRLGHEQQRVLDVMATVDAGLRYDVNILPHVSYAQVASALVRERPRIAHFGGHGRRGGNIVFAGGRQVSPSLMADLCATLSPAPEVVVFMCCDSAAMAEAVAVHVVHAIGFAGALDDRMAPYFSAVLYEHYALVGDLRLAFRMARNAASIEHESAGLARLFGRGGEPIF